MEEVFGIDTGNDFDVHTIPISALALGRFPFLRDDDHPRGLIQPYAGFGPSLFVTVVDASGLFGNYHARSADLGLDFVGGMNFQITEWLGLFLEYRFTQYTAKLDDDIDVFNPAGRTRRNVDMDLDLQTHHITGGIGFHF